MHGKGIIEMIHSDTDLFSMAGAIPERLKATLSRYLNNAVMAISGQYQLLNSLRSEGQTDKWLKYLDSSFIKVNDSIFRI